MQKASTSVGDYDDLIHSVQLKNLEVKICYFHECNTYTG